MFGTYSDSHLQGLYTRLQMSNRGKLLQGVFPVILVSPNDFQMNKISNVQIILRVIYPQLNVDINKIKQKLYEKDLFYKDIVPCTQSIKYRAYLTWENARYL